MASEEPAPEAVSFPFPFRQNHKHTNWPGSFTSLPSLVIFPRSESQIASTIRLARTSRRRITVAGSGHTLNDLTCTSSWMLSLENLDRVVSVDKDLGVVTAQAGIPLGRLLDVLERDWGLTMPNLGTITDQTLAGCFATGTHGSSLRHGLLSECIVAMRIVLANGEIVACSRDGDRDGEGANAELFRAALLSLGAIGVITEISIQVVPTFSLRWTRSVVSDGSMLADWEGGSLWNRGEFVQVLWLPHARRAVIWSAEKVEKGSDDDGKETRPARSWLGTWLGRTVYRRLLGLGHYYPGILPWVERFTFTLEFGFRNGTTTTGVRRSIRALTTHFTNISQTVDEWALPLDNGPECLRRASAVLTPSSPLPGCSPDTIANISPASLPYSGDRCPPVHALIDLRVSNDASPAARAYLDPTGRPEGPTLFVNSVVSRPRAAAGLEPPGAREWHESFEKVVRPLGGRPHWAKNFVTVGAWEMGEMYGEDMQRWKWVRDQVDPDGVFVGPWLRRNVLGEGAKLVCEEVEAGREYVQGGWKILGRSGE